MSRYEHDHESRRAGEYGNRRPAGVRIAEGPRVPLAALLALSAVLLAGGGRSASAGVVIDIGVPPPVPRVVLAPAPRPGFLWAPGYWFWNGHAHAWHDGYWMRARPGWRWAPDGWVTHHGRYHFVRGHWVR